MAIADHDRAMLERPRDAVLVALGLRVEPAIEALERARDHLRRSCASSCGSAQ